MKKVILASVYGITSDDKLVTIETLEKWFNQFSNMFKMEISVYQNYYRMKIKYMPKDKWLVCDRFEDFTDLLEGIFNAYDALRYALDEEDRND